MFNWIVNWFKTEEIKVEHFIEHLEGVGAALDAHAEEMTAKAEAQAKVAAEAQANVVAHTAEADKATAIADAISAVTLK